MEVTEGNRQTLPDQVPDCADVLHFQVVGAIKDIERLKALFDLFAAGLDQIHARIAGTRRDLNRSPKSIECPEP